MKNILVTGGAGFIGSHICLDLLIKSYNVYVIDSFFNSSPKSLERVVNILNSQTGHRYSSIKVFKGDICSKTFIETVFQYFYEKKINIDGVIHLAGLKSVSDSLINPILYWKKNFLGIINLIELMKKINCTTLVFSSSATVYGNHGNISLKETFNTNPINPYGNTKFFAEIFLNDIFNKNELNWKFASLRYFNPIGAHHSGLLGEDPKGIPNNIFPLIINTALGIQKEFKIYGKDWPTKDGTAIRDYIHVMDLAESHVKIFEYLNFQKTINLKLNVGTGRETSVLDLLQTFQEVNKVKIPFVFCDRRPGDMPYLVADNNLLISKFKIVPTRNITDMCRDGWRWKQLNPEGY